MTASCVVLMVIPTIGLLAAPLVAEAQQPARTPRIGLAYFSGRGDSCVEAFRRGLREAGYVEGQTVEVAYRYAENKTERYAGLMSEVVGLKPDVIAVAATGLAQVARQATRTIPVVFMFADQPVAMGLVASLGRPGGNLTGLVTLNSELGGKQLELLREALPRLKRVGVLSSAYRLTALAVKEAEAAARALRIELRPVKAEGLDDLDGAFAEMVKQRVEAVLVVPRPFSSRPIVERALAHRLPVVGNRGDGRNGALIGYGADQDDLCRRSASLVDRILKGRKPAELPVEQPTKLELIINLKTAKALGVTIPQSLLLRADKVIE